MGDDYDDAGDGEELFNNDFDDTDTTLRTGVSKRVCPECQKSLDYRVEGRFVIRFCKDCKYEEED